MNVIDKGSSFYKIGVTKPTTAGTRTQMTNVPCRSVTITALLNNTGKIYIGNESVTTTVFGAELLAGGSVTIPVNNLNLIYIIAEVANEGVSYGAV